MALSHLNGIAHWLRTPKRVLCFRVLLSSLHGPLHMCITDLASIDFDTCKRWDNCTLHVENNAIRNYMSLGIRDFKGKTTTKTSSRFNILLVLVSCWQLMLVSHPSFQRTCYNRNRIEELKNTRIMSCNTLLKVLPPKKHAHWIKYCRLLLIMHRRK